MAGVTALPSFATSVAAIVMSGVSLARIQVLEDKVQNGVSGASITGPGGPPGPTGSRGLQGPQGVAGPPGSSSGDKSYANYSCGTSSASSAPIPSGGLLPTLLVGNTPFTTFNQSGPYTWVATQTGVSLTIVGIPGSTDILFLKINASVNITMNSTNSPIVPGAANPMMGIRLTQRDPSVDTLITQTFAPVLVPNVNINYDLTLSGSVQFPLSTDATLDFLLQIDAQPITANSAPVLTGTYSTNSIQMGINEF